MEKQRDWLDYAQLASNIGQNIQLGGIKGSLNELRNIEAQRQQSEEHRAWFRKMIFRLEDDFEAVQDSQTSAPSKELLWRVLKMQNCLRLLARQSNITYEDKDRHRALARQVESTKAETEKALPSEVAVDVAKAVEYDASLSGLEEGIEYKKAVEALTKAKELASGLLRGPTVFGMKLRDLAIGLLISIVLLIIGGIISSRVNPDIDSGSMAFSVIMGLSGAIGVLTFGIAFAYRGLWLIGVVPDPDAHKSTSEIATLEANLPDRELLFLFDETGLDEKLSFAELTKIQQERLEFIRQVMGSNFEN